LAIAQSIKHQPNQNTNDDTIHNLRGGLRPLTTVLLQGPAEQNQELLVPGYHIPQGHQGLVRPIIQINGGGLEILLERLSLGLGSLGIFTQTGGDDIHEVVGWVGEGRAGKASFGKESDGFTRRALIDDLACFEQDEVVKEGEELGLRLVDGADHRGASAGCQSLELRAERQGRDGIET
jgi:hypothetical protein